MIGTRRRAFQPGTGGWSFLVGMGSVLHLFPGVTNPVYEGTESVAPEGIDTAAIFGYWEEVGADLAEAMDRTAKVA